VQIDATRAPRSTARRIAGADLVVRLPDFRRVIAIWFLAGAPSMARAGVERAASRGIDRGAMKGQSV
jgi:hypothetical protein